MPAIGKNRPIDNKKVASFANELRKRGAKSPKEMAEPLWKGPCDAGPQGGITQSLTGRWLNCRDRFRLYAILGLQPFDRFNHRLGYGSMWHLCEETIAKNPLVVNGKGRWEDALKLHCQKACRQYPTQQKEIEKWYQVCKAQFPLYYKHYAKRKDQLGFEPLLQEQVFHVPYSLPSCRTVYLRGRWDGIDFLPKDKTITVNGRKVVYKRGIYLFETKTKGEVDKSSIEQQLKFDLQTMLYLVALQTDQKDVMGRLSAIEDKSTGKLTDAGDSPIQGVRYNVIKRPLSGGKGNITPHKATKGSKCPKCKGAGKAKDKRTGKMLSCPKCKGNKRIGAKPEETSQHFYERLGKVIEPNSEEFFHRWNVQITTEDIETFRKTCLDPILEAMCDWYEHITGSRYYEEGGMISCRALHWRHPYGVYNALDEGGSTEYDAYYETGSIAGLTRAETLFRELEE